MVRRAELYDRADTAQRPADLLDAQDGRELPLPLRPQELEERPIPLQHLLEEEPNPGVADPQGRGGPTADVPPVQEVGLQLVRRDRVGRLVLELDEHAHGTRVRLLGALPFAVQLQGVDHAVVPLGLHPGLPPFLDEKRWGTAMVSRTPLVRRMTMSWQSTSSIHPLFGRACDRRNRPS